MKLALILIFSIITTESFAAHNRMWMGFKKEDVSTASFLNGLNQTFFKETIEVSKGRGLKAYQPYVTNMKGEIPDELALVTYESEEKYLHIRSTPQGQRYGALHWEYFEKGNSKSTVSRPFTGNLEDGQAAELIPSFLDWQKGFTHVAIYSREPNQDMAELAATFKNLKLNQNVNNSIILVTTKWIIEYRSLKTATSEYQKFPLKLLELKLLPKKELKDLKSPVGFGRWD